MPEVEPQGGIDLRLTHFAVTSDGMKVAAPKFLRRAARKLKRTRTPRVPLPAQASHTC